MSRGKRGVHAIGIRQSGMVAREPCPELTLETNQRPRSGGVLFECVGVWCHH
jgi:hypothetical protein